MYTYPQWDLLSNIVLSVLSIIVLLVFAGIAYAIIYAIFMFIFSGWSDEKIKKAWNSIRYAILWFLLTLVVLFAIPGALRTLKVPGYQYYTSSNIFKTAKIWLNKIIDVFNQQKNPVNADENYEL